MEKSERDELESKEKFEAAKKNLELIREKLELVRKYPGTPPIPMPKKGQWTTPDDPKILEFHLVRLS